MSDEEQAGHRMTLPSSRMAVLRLFASAREAAGTGRDVIDEPTVAVVLAEATRRYGASFGEVLAACRVWRNGEPAADADEVGPTDEVAVLPPVSGG
jgi:molybdopterin synthase sulfur carrier subunit